MGELMNGPMRTLVEQVARMWATHPERDKYTAIWPQLEFIASQAREPAGRLTLDLLQSIRNEQVAVVALSR